MKKNWVLFIAICTITYVGLFYIQHQKQQEYRAQKKAWDAKQAVLVKQKEADAAARKAAEEEQRQQLAAEAAAKKAAAGEAAEATEEDIAKLAAEKGIGGEIYTVKTAPFQVVDTPLFRVVVSNLGARPIDWQIKSSPFVTNVAPNGKEEDVTVQLIPQAGDFEKREFPLSFTGQTVHRFNDELFTVERQDTKDAIILAYTSPQVDGLKVVKELTFRKDSYAVGVNVKFLNGPETRVRLGSKDSGFGIGWQGGFGDPKTDEGRLGTVSSVISQGTKIRTRAISSPDEPWELNQEIGWGGQEKKYFATLLIPGENNQFASIKASYRQQNADEIFAKHSLGPPMSIEMMQPARDLDVNEAATYSYTLYAGPKNLESMKELKAPAGMSEPSRVVFHQIPLGMGWLRGLCLLLLSLMRELHEFTKAWGVAIIATTFIVRIVIYPLTHWAIKAQARTMIEQQKIRPELEAINKRYKGDAQKRNQAMMQLYRDHNINPLGMFRGCLPILLQMPVFIALYVVFEQSVELKGQNFLWITDLSGPDRLVPFGMHIPLVGDAFNLLPVLMGITSFFQMRLMQTPATDEMQAAIQKQMMVLMPIMFGFIVYTFPSGLTLYWTISNVWGIGQSWLTKRMIASHMEAHNKAASAGSAVAVQQ